MKPRYACDYFQSVFPRKITLPYFKRLAEQQEYSVLPPAVTVGCSRPKRC